MVERQGADDGQLTVELLALEPRLHPCFRGQQVRHDRVVKERGALGDAGRAAGILQDRHILRPEIGTGELHRAAGGNHGVELEMSRQRPCRNQLAHLANDEVDDAALEEAHEVAERSDDDMLDRRAGDCFLERRREVLENDHRLRAGIHELMMQFGRRVERIDVDRDEPGLQHRRDGHGILQHVGHHDRDPGAPLQPAALQPGRERLRQRIDLAEGQCLVHADIGLGVAILGEALLEQRYDAGIDRRVDIRRYAWRVTLEPEPIHSTPPDIPSLETI